MNEKKLFTANDVLCFLDGISDSLKQDRHIEAYDKVRRLQEKLMNVRENK